ncbi:MAG: alpha/beta hydrolase [Thermoanaerobacterales bacterium]|jgi:pimeloyl-ACP methyl ester carboxylesterase|nr:alpha/beta hydrolase [Thermoanaerobacterales bacterium]
MTTSMRTRAGALQAVHDPHHGTFDWRGRTLAYEVHGRGDRVVVLMHGLLMDARLNRGVARALAARGYRVVLLDLLGHGESDRPHRAAEYRMDTYVDQVVALLDHLGLDRAVVGGVSLGANVSLLLAARHPERVTALWIEMPVLERAVPAAAMTFVPALVTLHYAMPLARLASRVARVLRRTRHDLVASALAPLASPPDTAVAVLHGILVGPVAPTKDERRAIEVPALVIGHRADLIHPFSDAEALARQMPNATLVQAHSIVELRLRPGRLMGEIDRFLAGVWADEELPAAAGH